MRIALVQLPLNSPNPIAPIGLLSLATYIKQHGHHPIITDINLSFKTKKYHADFFKKTAKTILRHGPQAVGFSVMCNTFPAALLIARECKRISPQLPIIFGGPDVSFEDIETLKAFDQIDIIIRSEGEITLLEVLMALEKREPLRNVLGITFREKGRVLRNPDRPFIANLDDLPRLDFSLLPQLEKYRTGSIEAGRGCPYQCTFCSTCKMWKRSFRIKSAQRLAQELEQVYHLFKKDEDSLAFIIHDHFLASRELAEKFLSLLVNKNLSWSCSSRLDVLDENLIRKLKSAGCRRIYLGIESGSAEIQKMIKKNIPLSRLPKILKQLSQNEILPVLSFMIGFPGEKTEQIDQTLLAALKSKLSCPPANIQLHILAILKGSELYNESAGNQLLQTDFSSLLTSHPNEISMIRKYPRVFPSFYYISNNSIDPRILHKISILYTFLIHFFPLSTMLLLKHFSLSPLQLGEKLIASFEKKGISWILFFEEGATFDFYEPFLEHFIQNTNIALIEEFFTHEQLLQKINFIKNLTCRSEGEINLESHPRITKGIRIKTYNYDLPFIMDNLENYRNKKAFKAKCFIAYVPGKTSRAVSLGPLTHRLLAFCDGRRSIRDIISQSLGPGIKRGAKVMLEKFKTLQKQDVISI